MNWSIQAFRRNHTNMKLIDTDGTPVLRYSDDMVGGTQEDPILEFRSRELHLPPAPVGTRFRCQADRWAMAHWYVVVNEETARRLDWAEAQHLEKLWQSIQNDSWISEDFVAARRAQLKELTTA